MVHLIFCRELDFVVKVVEVLCDFSYICMSGIENEENIVYASAVVYNLMLACYVWQVGVFQVLQEYFCY